WDREGHRDENSSCWIRVSQGWAGKNWGMVHLPRVGQEVVVAFLEGDPDQPIVVGRVYNGENMPPYDLPANKTQSGVKSRSTPGGSPDNFNEIRFEDKKGREQLYIHAERTLTTVVEGSESHSVGGSRSTAVGQDETLVVKKGNRTTTLEEGNDALTITKGNRDTDISQGNDTLFVAQGNIEIGAPAGAYHVTSKTVLIEGTEKITLSCGGSSITIEPGKISISSPQISSVASGIHDIKGALVKVNSRATQPPGRRPASHLRRRRLRHRRRRGPDCSHPRWPTLTCARPLMGPSRTGVDRFSPHRLRCSGNTCQESGWPTSPCAWGPWT